MMFKGVLLLLAIFVLAGCSQRAQGAAPSAVGETTRVAEVSMAASGTNDTGAPRTAAITLAPGVGYAGTFVGVTGTGWPSSAMVVVKLADAQGRSPVLAAVATDAKGQFTTGFVYPVGDRWLNRGPETVVAHTENGLVETTAPFAVVPPAGVVLPTPTLTPTLTAAPTLTATIPFTSGALAATPAPSATPLPTATPAPTATAVPTLPPTTAATSTPVATATSTAAPSPQAGPTAYPSPVSTIDELIGAIKEMPPGDLAPELANSLVKKLTNAQKQVDKGHATPAANMLRAFQHEVAAQWGKKIDDAAATFLTISADNVIADLQPSRSSGNDNGSDKGSDNGRGNDKDKGSDNSNGKGHGKGNGNDGGNGKGKGHGNG